MKLLSSLSLDMITFSLISSWPSTSLWRCFLPVLHMIIDHMDNWTSHWPSISLWRSCPPSCWWLSPSSPPARDARQHHYLLLVIIPELLFVCENFFPEYRICFCFQFLVVGRLCAFILDSLLYLPFTFTVKIVLIILTIIQTNAQGARKIPPTPDLLLLQVVSALEAAQEAALLLAWVFPFGNCLIMCIVENLCY